MILTLAYGGGGGSRGKSVEEGVTYNRKKKEQGRSVGGHRMKGLASDHL